MKYLPRAIAFGKLRALAEGAATVRRELREPADRRERRPVSLLSWLFFPRWLGRPPEKRLPRAGAIATLTGTSPAHLARRPT